MARGSGQDEEGPVLSSLARRVQRRAGEGSQSAPTSGAPVDDIVSGRLIGLATRLAVASAPAAPPLQVDQSSAGDWGAPLALGDNQRQNLIAEKIRKLAECDQPGEHAIVLPAQPAPLANGPTALGPAVDAAPVPRQSEARLADMILEQRLIMDRLDAALLTLSREPPPAPPQHATPAASARGSVAYDLLTAGERKDADAAPAGTTTSAQAQHPVAGEATTSPRRQPVDRETWVERIFADGLPGFVVGILASIAIGIALYILLRRL